MFPILISFYRNIEDDSWTWNDDPTKPPKYFNWAEGEPNVNPDADSNYVLLKEDYNSGGDDPMGTWVVPDMQNDVNYYICQSPKIPFSDKTTPDPDFTTTTEPWWDTTTTTEPWWDTTTTPSDDDMVCMEGFDDLVPGTGKCYHISTEDELQNWEDAEDACDAMINYGYNVEYTAQNTKLVVLNSDDENDNLFNILVDMAIDSVWIGLSGPGKYTSFKQGKFINPN